MKLLSQFSKLFNIVILFIFISSIYYIIVNYYLSPYAISGEMKATFDSDISVDKLKGKTSSTNYFRTNVTLVTKSNILHHSDQVKILNSNPVKIPKDIEFDIPYKIKDLRIPKSNQLYRDIDIDVSTTLVTDSMITDDITPLTTDNLLAVTMNTELEEKKDLMQNVVTNEILLSTSRPVIADVRGNLGPASVVTDESVKDWLADRWQAALNMRGEPIPGPHWLVIDLQRMCLPTRVLLDWEAAYSDHWIIQGRVRDSGPWFKLVGSKEMKTITHELKHIIQEVRIHTPNSTSKYLEDARQHQHVPHDVNAKEDVPLRQSPRDLPSTLATSNNRSNNSNGSSSSSSSSSSSGNISGSNVLWVRYIRLYISKASTRWGVSLWRFQVWGHEHPNKIV